MTAALKGRLYYEALGPSDAPPMLFVHPNPMDSSCWLFQMAHFSTWFRCVAVDVAHWFARLFVERNESADIESIIRNFEALEPPDPEWLQRDLCAPVLIVSGEQDPTHEAAPALHERLPDAELITLGGAGHACHMEQPWAFDEQVMGFLRRRGICPVS